MLGRPGAGFACPLASVVRGQPSLPRNASEPNTICFLVFDKIIKDLKCKGTLSIRKHFTSASTVKPSHSPCQRSAAAAQAPFKVLGRQAGRQGQRCKGHCHCQDPEAGARLAGARLAQAAGMEGSTGVLRGAQFPPSLVSHGKETGLDEKLLQVFTTRTLPGMTDRPGQGSASDSRGPLAFVTEVLLGSHHTHWFMCWLW